MAASASSISSFSCTNALQFSGNRICRSTAFPWNDKCSQYRGVDDCSIISVAKKTNVNVIQSKKQNKTMGKGKGLRVSASSDTAVSVESEKAVESFPKLKEFLEKAKNVGRVRIVVNTGLGVLESVTTLDGLFFRAFGDKGEYGNLMKQEENIDFHLLLNKVAKVKLTKTPAMFDSNITVHSIRFLDGSENVGASVIVMWKLGTKGEYDEGQVEAFEEIFSEYGEEFTFSEESQS